MPSQKIDHMWSNDELRTRHSEGRIDVSEEVWLVDFDMEPTSLGGVYVEIQRGLKIGLDVVMHLVGKCVDVRLIKCGQLLADDLEVGIKGRTAPTEGSIDDASGVRDAKQCACTDLVAAEIVAAEHLAQIFDEGLKRTLEQSQLEDFVLLNILLVEMATKIRWLVATASQTLLCE